MRLRAVGRNERFHEVPVEIFQCVTGCVSQAARTTPQLLPDKGQPDVLNHAHPRPQPRGRTARMRFQKIFHVLSDDGRQCFDWQ